MAPPTPDDRASLSDVIFLHEPSDMRSVPSTDVVVSYLPILDVARGVAAGFQAVAAPTEQLPPGRMIHPASRRHLTANIVSAALASASTLPTNTFISIPIPLRLADDGLIGRLLREHGDLGGVVLDITDFDSDVAAKTESALEGFRRAGALIAVGGRDDAQPELGSIVRLRPAIIRLGAAWTRDLDQHPARRTAIEVTGRLAGQLDAWILADGVASAAELRTLAGLGVPLAQGPFIGQAQSTWPEIRPATKVVLPPAAVTTDGALRALLQQAYTTRHLAAAETVLPEASGFEHVVVVDEASRPVSLLHQGALGAWEPLEVLTVNVDTPVPEAVTRALARPRATRFSPITCTDDAGRFVGILRIERLMEHLALTATP
jgi:EAL domain-containing protein (putative c-di-GMP-specific phosphodiesterase class I)